MQALPGVLLCPSTRPTRVPPGPVHPLQLSRGRGSPVSAARPPQPRYQHAAFVPELTFSGAKSPGSSGGGRTLSLSGSCRVGDSWTGRALIDYTEDLGLLTARAALAGGEASAACRAGGDGRSPRSCYHLFQPR